MLRKARAAYADKEKFRTIYYLFSHEAVLDGSILHFAKGLPKLSRKKAQRDRAEVEHQDIDESFLQELEAGDVGTVVHVYKDGQAYEVEFVTLDGHTAAVVTLEASQVRPVGRLDITHASEPQV
jgi:uncharacterized iron-regulated membrane protein